MKPKPGLWRVEADADWLAAHRSARLRRRRGGLAQAIAGADLGFLGAPAVNPPLKIGATAYSYMRHVESGYAYTQIAVQHSYCRRCGNWTLETHQLLLRDGAGGEQYLGQVALCSDCDGESWMFKVHGPCTEAARKRAAKTVL